MSMNFKLNGTSFAVNLLNLPADITLNTFVREHAQLTATKFMCLEGGCGACICVIKGKHPGTGEVLTWAANSCLTLLNTCQNMEIITAEGIGNKRSGYHPIQKRLAKMNGSQCGFCSPGFVMNMYGLLESKNGQVTMEEVENSFGGNICRCTGYRPILDAMKSFALDSTIEIPAECQDIEELDKKICPKVCNTGSCHKPLTNLTYGDGMQWHWPKSLVTLFEVLYSVGNEPYMLVGGNTAHGVYRRSTDIKHFIDVNGIMDLKNHTLVTDRLTLGGNMSLSGTMDVFKKASNNPGFEYCEQLWQHFDLIANVPVRNTGTLAGNISIKKLHPEFPSDVFITFEALNAQVIVSENATTQKMMSLSEYLKAPTNKMLLTAFVLKSYPKEKFLFNSYKIMPRAQNAHAYVNAAFLLKVNRNSNTVNAARICFGGINPNFTHASSVEKIINTQDLYSQEMFTKIFNDLFTTIEPHDILPDSSPEYRRSLACGLFYKFLIKNAPKDKVKEIFKSGGETLKRPLSSGIQSFETIEKNYPITKPVQKLEAMIQCSGEATYMNDILTPNNTVYCAFVNATKVGATIEQIDASKALTMPGVISFYSAKDIPGTNNFTEASFKYVEEEEIFCTGVVKYFDQPLGVIVAINSDIANRASTKVNVIYSSEERGVYPTMADVFENNQTDRIRKIVESPLKVAQLREAADITAKGVFEIGSQYHFTMEPHTTVAVPFEDVLQIWCATQWMDHTQCVIAKMLQMKISAVQLIVRRLGGGYGCKISRCNQVACAAALVAFKLNRPARFVQTIESMMSSNGKRWACRSDYEFHVKSNGKIVGLTNQFYEDAGCTLNESPLELSIPCAKNCYEFTSNNYKLVGQAVITDAPSSTWCRAPGSVEGIAMIENILEHIAFETKTDPADVRLANIIPGNKMARLLPRFIKTTEYRGRRKEIYDFNSKNRWLKRGLGLAIMEYPIFYEGQYPATVVIYHSDGTVVVSHGGIEMGQGMNTKIAQVVAYYLKIPFELVKIESSNTINGANSEVTGASVTTEGICYAVRKACITLNSRIKPIKDSLAKDATWQEIVRTAWSRDINLLASDSNKKSDMRSYSVHGLALTEIEIDILTGVNMIKRVDILEDTGESLSPYIDIGQVEGAFVMGLGYWLTELLVYDRRTGQLLTNRTWNYKPPGAKAIPIDFRIELLQKSPNPGGFLRSKAAGEPPCCLAVSAIFAVQHALQSARKDAGLKHEWVRLGAPTTPETIVLNSGNNPKTFSLT